MKTLLLLTTALMMAGCAPELLKTTDKLIVVKARRGDAMGATEVAEAECLKRGLHARLVMKLASEEFGFECVR